MTTAITGATGQLGRLVVERLKAKLPPDQILALARCLCGRPKLLLLDEPTEGIQPSIVDEIAAILVDLHRVHGLAMVVVEQNLDFISRLSDRVLLIERGRITGEITPDALTEHQDLGGFAAA